MISLTMSRISSRAASASSLRELRQVDRLDQGAEDRALDLVIGLGRARLSVATAAARRGLLARARAAARRAARRARRRHRRAAADRGCGGAAASATRCGAGGAAAAPAPCARPDLIAARLPNTARLRAFRLALAQLLEQRREQAALARFFTSARPVSSWASWRNISAVGGLADTSAIIWPLLAAVPNSCGSNGMIATGSIVERLGEVGRLDLRPLRHADLVEAVAGRRSFGARRLAAGRCMFLALRRLARSGAATIRISSARDQRALASSRSTDAARRARCTARWRAAISRIASNASSPKS